MHFVLSCDIVNSSSLSVRDKDHLQGQIRNYVQQLLDCSKHSIKFYRGDAFQILCTNDDYAISTAIGIRAVAKALFPDNDTIDIRVSMGVGKIERWPTDKVQAEGEVLTVSGQGLDQISKYEKRLKIGGYNSSSIHPLDLTIYEVVLDDIINGWSRRQAEAVSHTILGHKQKEIAKIMSTKQNAVSRFLKIAKWEIIQGIMFRFRIMELI